MKIIGVRLRENKTYTIEGKNYTVNKADIYYTVDELRNGVGCYAGSVSVDIEKLCDMAGIALPTSAEAIYAALQNRSISIRSGRYGAYIDKIE